jgi:hypothetical protein
MRCRRNEWRCELARHPEPGEEGVPVEFEALHVAVAESPRDLD